MTSPYQPAGARINSIQSLASNSTVSDNSRYSQFSQSSYLSDTSAHSQKSTNPRLKPLPLSPDPQPALHNRQPSLDYFSSGYQPRSHSRDQSPSSQGRYVAAAPIHPSYSLQDLTTLPRGRSPPRQLPHPRKNDFIFEESLLPPPQFGDDVRDRPLTPTSIPTSRQESPTGSYPSRPGSAGAVGNRNISPHPTLDIQQPPTPEGKLKKKGWLGGKSHKRSKNGSGDQGLQAWILTNHGRVVYDLSYLINSQVTELWDDRGDSFVHLFPSSLGQGASFRIHSSTFASSRTLTSFAYGGSNNTPVHLQTSQSAYDLSKHTRNISLDSYATKNLHAPHKRNFSMQVPPSPMSPQTLYSGTSSEGYQEGQWDMSQSPKEYHIYLPLGISGDPTTGLSAQQTEQLVATRNLFAFITGQALVATPGQPALFAILLNVANLLQHYDFSNFDGTTFGEVPAACTSRYVEEFQLADIRASREKTMEAIVLGERLRCWELYNEGFVHAVGKWDEITHLKTPVFHLITDLSRTRMERASRDLDIRRRSVEHRLQNFDFPSIWAGIAESNTEFKSIDFKAWKSSFLSMRKYVLSHYQKKYGAWPPKASSKKNRFTESGLNRLLLGEVYQDFSDLYDMLVDRTSMTPRTTDFLLHDGSAMLDPSMPLQHILRQLLSEFDRSSPPIQPPVPFDTPMLPNLEITRRDLKNLPEKNQEKQKKKSLKDNEINELLLKSSNLDSIRATPFIESFIAYERQAAHSKSVIEIANLRIGQWIFLYAVLQSLPLVVVDAPGLKHTAGVEYFLCEVPKGSLPWCKDDSSGRKKAWYSVPGGQGVVSLPSDSVDHSIDGIYHRSHCWQVAEKWLAHSTPPRGFPSAPASNDFDLKEFSNSPPRAPYINHAQTSPLPLPPSLNYDPNYAHSRSSSIGGPGSSTRSHSSSPVLQGLEALPLPPGISPYGVGARQSPSYDPSKSFEGIIGEERVLRGGGKKR
ncbi:MAG: hypothetical protein MMC33_009874 [Icmadophila ericetorum]|nr:hypothetical protein [Icmadophila ericetorum]